MDIRPARTYLLNELNSLLNDALWLSGSERWPRSSGGRHEGCIHRIHGYECPPNYINWLKVVEVLGSQDRSGVTVPSAVVKRPLAALLVLGLAPVIEASSA